MTSRFLRFWVRVCLAAMLLATLAPAISRTLASTRGMGDWVEICSGTGMRWVQLGAVDAGGDTGDPKSLQLLFAECGHCLLSADRFAPLIPSMPAFAGAASGWPVPLHRDHSAVSISAPSPSARGPPLLF